LFPVLPRRSSKVLLEGALEVGLVGKAAFGCGIGNRRAPL
jgi:hypothetical protein